MEEIGILIGWLISGIIGCLIYNKTFTYGDRAVKYIWNTLVLLLGVFGLFTAILTWISSKIQPEFRSKKIEMELKYGNTKTYKYTLDKERLTWLTERTNRSTGQTQFLYQLVDGDFEKLKQFEMQNKNCLYFSCPADKHELEKVMKMEARTKLLEL